MSFDFIHSLEEQNTASILREKLLFENVFEISEMCNPDGYISENVATFVKDAREFIKHGNFPSWQRKSDPDDEQPDGEINNLDKFLYLGKVIAGLFYYIKKDLKTADDAAFDQVVDGLTSVDMVDANVKAQAEKVPQLLKFAQEVEKTFTSPATKRKLEAYLDQIEDYFVKGQPA